ncbi:unnamed protein product [Polarella glacialis]|uniref:RING-type domain-containing protein n=1 Tax=Polarella glacialis TaxID=89957 RepID=A0A813ID67_POLGL|nr:unnamed protein product [Polarella glacialis]
MTVPEEANTSTGDAAECAICLGALERACRAPCQHSYCRSCILRWLGSRAPEWSGACPLCLRVLSVYQLVDVVSDAPLAIPQERSLFGLVFVQTPGLGCASYHFDAENDCYVSYASAPETWKLDDGSMPPAKKPFTDASWDPQTRTFRGVIEWAPGQKFDGQSRWEYEIVFAEDFFGIIGGSVTCDGTDRTEFEPPWGERGTGLTYLRWTAPPSTIFGSVYVQGIEYQGILEGIASYHFDSEEDCYISYADAPGSWLLDDGNPPPVKKPFEQCRYHAESRTFSATVRWEPTFNRAALWEYEFTFSEDFSRITGGTFKPFGVDGSAMRAMVFGDPASQIRRLMEMHYVRKPGALMAAQDLLALLSSIDD